MSKAILVIDMPKRCKDCFRYRADPWYGGRCTQAKEENGWNKKIDADEEYNVQNWCPLRPYQESIPIEWILNKYRGKWEKAEMGRRDFQFIEVIDELLADWKKENQSLE